MIETFRAIADNTKRLKLFSIRFYNITFIDEDYWFGWDESFYSVKIRSSCRGRSNLLRDDWKDVLQYWLYVLFHEGDRKYQ